MRNLPQLLREAERRVNAHVWPNRANTAGHDANLASIPANRDTDTDLLLIEAADRLEAAERVIRRLCDPAPIGEGRQQFFDDTWAECQAWFGSEPSEQQNRECIAHGCRNQDDEGSFIGNLCLPCHAALTSGKGEHGKSILFTRPARIRMLEAALQAMLDRFGVAAGESLACDQARKLLATSNRSSVTK